MQNDSERAATLSISASVASVSSPCWESKHFRILHSVLARARGVDAHQCWMSRRSAMRGERGLRRLKIELAARAAGREARTAVLMPWQWDRYYVVQPSDDGESASASAPHIRVREPHRD